MQVQICWSTIWIEFGRFNLRAPENAQWVSMVLVIWTESIVFISQLVVFGLMLLHWVNALEVLLEKRSLESRWVRSWFCSWVNLIALKKVCFGSQSCV